MKNPTFNVWEEEAELKKVTNTIREGEDKSEDEIVLTRFINMVIIDNLYIWVPLGTLVLKKQAVASMIYFNSYMLLFSHSLVFQ